MARLLRAQPSGRRDNKFHPERIVTGGTLFFQTLSVASTFTPSLAKKMLYKVTLKPVSSAFTPKIQRYIKLTLKVSATFTPTLVKKMYVTLKPATSAFVSSLSSRLTVKKTLKPPSDPFSPTLTPVFQAGHSTNFLSHFFEWLDDKLSSP